MVPSLTKDIIKRPDREFQATFAEWAADNIEQVLIGGNQLAGANTTIFTCPDNFTFFITSATFCVDSDGAGAPGVANASLVVQALTRQIFLISYDRDHDEQFTQNQTFLMPIKVNSGENIIISDDGSIAHISATISGFLLPKKISIR